MFAKLGYTKLQANNEPEKLVFALIGEMLIFVPLMIVSLLWFGVLGAAFVFALRQIVDAIVLNGLAFGRACYPVRFILIAGLLAGCSYLTQFMLDFTLLSRAVVVLAVLTPVTLASYFAAPGIYHMAFRLILRSGDNERANSLPR